MAEHFSPVKQTQLQWHEIQRKRKCRLYQIRSSIQDQKTFNQHKHKMQHQPRRLGNSRMLLLITLFVICGFSFVVILEDVVHSAVKVSWITPHFWSIRKDQILETPLNSHPQAQRRILMMSSVTYNVPNCTPKLWNLFSAHLCFNKTMSWAAILGFGVQFGLQ